MDQWDYLRMFTLGQKIGTIWTLRVATSGSIRRLFRKMPIFILSDNQDEMKAEFMKIQVKHALLRYVQRETVDTSKVIKIKDINLRDYYANFEYSENSIYFGTGWWLGGAEKVTVSGSFCVSNYNIYVFSMDLRWYDTIDARPEDEPGKNVTESIYQKIEPIFDIDFGVEIPWSLKLEVLP